MNNKLIDKTKLVSVKTYATSIGQTTQWVYKLIEQGKVKSEVIDGKVFVVPQSK